MEIETLDEFSTLMLGLFLKAYPQWESLIRTCDDYKGAFYIIVPSSQSSKLTLDISTIHEELTVGYGNYHSHFGWSDVPDEEAFRLAKKMIDEIINNEVLVAEFYENGELYQSEIIESEELETYLSLGRDVKVIGWNESHAGR
ncbi:hypothetical protein A9Q99_14575 [Gammaproteobacteria bacterium 45_16_T64]|nr:hypothetical protein A9Q99_14575 [Gammaproteobacteria bacterium 45_16_T64]